MCRRHDPGRVHDRERHGLEREGRVLGSKVAFKEPSDSNVLVGLPAAGDSAMFTIAVTPTAAGSTSWTAVAYDKPGSSTSTKCGSGAFPTKTLSFSVAPAPTPRPTPTPTP